MAIDEKGSAQLSEIERLVNIEKIRELKARYWAAVDAQQWSEVAEYFVSPDTEIKLRMSFPDGRPLKTVRDFCEFCAGPYYKGTRSLHLGHNWIIDFQSPTRAEGTWKFGAVEYPVGTNPHDTSATVHWWGYHKDRYEKTPDRGWRIAFTDYTANTGTFTMFEPAKFKDKWRNVPPDSM